MKKIICSALVAFVAIVMMGCDKKSAKPDSKSDSTSAKSNSASAKPDPAPAPAVPSYSECMTRLSHCDKGCPLAIDIVKSIVERRQSKKSSYEDNIPDNTADVLLDVGALTGAMDASMIEKIEKHPRSSPLAREISSAVVMHILGRSQQIAPIAQDVLDVIDDCKIFTR